MASTAKLGIITVAVISAMFAAHAEPQDGKRTPEKESKPAEAAAKTQIRYVPPDVGAPEVRVSGGTRGIRGDDLSVSVLAPKQTGLTMQEQPTLYWYNSRTARAGVRLSIVVDNTDKTILNIRLPGVVSAGIHPFRLRETRVRLARDIDYEWSVTAVQSQDPSENIVASGMIRRVRSPDGSGDLQLKITFDAATHYAHLGLWYDAMQALSEAIPTSPDGMNLRLQRSDLLNQVGLTDAAAWDRAGLR
jgi:Domain of Unknown Function (DUF928)